jgi:hypothetical protein
VAASLSTSCCFLFIILRGSADDERECLPEDNLASLRDDDEEHANEPPPQLHFLPF